MPWVLRMAARWPLKLRHLSHCCNNLCIAAWPAVQRIQEDLEDAGNELMLSDEEQVC